MYIAFDVRLSISYSNFYLTRHHHIIVDKIMEFNAAVIHMKGDKIHIYQVWNRTAVFHSFDKLAL